MFCATRQELIEQVLASPVEAEEQGLYSLLYLVERVTNLFVWVFPTMSLHLSERGSK